MSNATRACIALLMLAAAPAFAQQAPAEGATPPAPVAWSSLAPEQRKVLSRLAGQWDSLPPARQQALAHGSDRWLGMSAEQRDKARERFSHWQSLPPDQRHALRSRWQKFQSLPPNEQARVRENFHKFQQLPPAQRQMLREQWHKASPAERQHMVEQARERGETGDRKSVAEGKRSDLGSRRITNK